nr:MAG: hypothetical protein TU36_01940 [Vulcanisaeta sp. AZ3]
MAAYLAGARGVLYVHESFRDAAILPLVPIEVKSYVKEFEDHRDLGRLAEAFRRDGIQTDPDDLEELGVVKGGGLAPWLKALMRPCR